MKVRLFGIFATAICVLTSWAVKAQELPLMPQAPAVQSCVFSNGLSCYAVGNATTKGLADITLVRRDHAGGKVVKAHMNVALSSEEAVDSVLLAMMRQVEADAVPADCALIVSGDIDAKTVITKLKYMSLMVDASDASACADYVWDGREEVSVTLEEDASAGLTVVRFHWQAPRLDAESMLTTQAVIYEKAAWELGEAAGMMIKRTLRKEDIPYADVRYHYDNSHNGLSHEEFSLEVTVASADAAAARRITESVLASLDRGETGYVDILLAEKAYMNRLEKGADKAVIGNNEYTELCVNSFLYGAPLYTDSERLAFFRSKDVPESSRRKMFSDITSAMINMPAQPDSAGYVPSGVMFSDTLALPGPSENRTKVRISKRDAFSGGAMWTFANGFKVIYHKMPSTGRRLYYSMSLRSGFGNVSDLERGEGAYMSDYLDLCWIAGVKGTCFQDLLNLSGMTMDTKVNLFNTVISGHVEDRDAALLMKSLLAVANESRPDTAEMEYYARCEALRMKSQHGADVRTAVDSVMCPGFRYSHFRTAAGVREGTFAKAQTLFTSMLSKMNDGLLVIVGDMDETQLKRLLQSYVGGFNVRNTASRRPSLSYHPVSGESSYTVEGDKDAVAVVVTAPLAMTAANHFSTDLAALVLERRLEDAFGDKDVRLSLSRSIYPDERFSIMVELSGKCTQDELALVHAVLADGNVSEQELGACKEYLKNSYALQAKSPGYWLRVVPLRHLEGKDFTTGAAAKIDAVSQEDVRNVFKALCGGAGMEYITIKK